MFTFYETFFLSSLKHYSKENQVQERNEKRKRISPATICSAMRVAQGEEGKEEAISFQIKKFSFSF